MEDLANLPLPGEKNNWSNGASFDIFWIRVDRSRTTSDWFLNWEILSTDFCPKDLKLLVVFDLLVFIFPSVDGWEEFFFLKGEVGGTLHCQIFGRWGRWRDKPSCFYREFLWPFSVGWRAMRVERWWKLWVGFNWNTLSPFLLCWLGQWAGTDEWSWENLRGLCCGWNLFPFFFSKLWRSALQCCMGATWKKRNALSHPPLPGPCWRDPRLFFSARRWQWTCWMTLRIFCAVNFHISREVNWAFCGVKAGGFWRCVLP